MAREKKSPPVEEPAGAPEWMVTFSDCMTLLLTFFVLLLSFSSFDDQDLAVMKDSMNNAFASVHQFKYSRDSFAQAKIIRHQKTIKKGSEKPTLEKSSQSSTLKMEQILANAHKLFVINTKDCFWGKGIVLTSQGQKTLSNIAELMKILQCRIAITVTSKSIKSNVNMPRITSIVNRLVKTEHVDRGYINITSESMRSDERNSENNSDVVEILFLRQELYN